jgi:hypothetical protein
LTCLSLSSGRCGGSGEAELRILSAKIAAIKKARYYADGAGLYLQVSDEVLGLPLDRVGFIRGSLSDVTLAEAHTAAAEQRALLRQNVEPIEAKRAARAPSAR